jgi:uncharacterized protein (TIGR01319 family)
MDSACFRRVSFNTWGRELLQPQLPPEMLAWAWTRQWQIFEPAPVPPSRIPNLYQQFGGGGLRMTVHGLTQNMTARAAREAALGAGAIIKMVTAGRLDESDLETIREIDPNIILLAGGVDYGEKEIVLHNARMLASLGIHAPVIYAGNTAIRTPIGRIFEAAGVETMLAENVFPGCGCPQRGTGAAVDSRGL